jgi:hypothetical protein
VASNNGSYSTLGKPGCSWAATEVAGRSQTGRRRLTDFSVVSVVDEGDAPYAVGPVGFLAIVIAVGFVRTDSEAVVVAIVVGDAGRALRAIHVARAALETAVATGELRQAYEFDLLIR